MRQWDEISPEYGFEKHKEYGTKAHIEAIKSNGICSIHRKTFVKNFLQNIIISCKEQFEWEKQQEESIKIILKAVGSNHCFLKL